MIEERLLQIAVMGSSQAKVTSEESVLAQELAKLAGLNNVCVVTRAVPGVEEIVERLVRHIRTPQIGFSSEVGPDEHFARYESKRYDLVTSYVGNADMRTVMMIHAATEGIVIIGGGGATIAAGFMALDRGKRIFVYQDPNKPNAFDPDFVHQFYPDKVHNVHRFTSLDDLRRIFGGIILPAEE